MNNPKFGYIKLACGHVVDQDAEDEPCQECAENPPTAYFTRFALEMPAEAVTDCSHQGPCDEDVAYWESRIERPDEITPEVLRAELKEYGAWDEEELADDGANWERLIWIAAGNIKEEAGQ